MISRHRFVFEAIYLSYRSHLFELSIFLLFVDSGSEDGPGGGDSSGGQFSDGVPSSVLPRRLFAYGAYPTKLRVNIYSKSHVIGSVAAALKGTDAMDTLMASQFRGLFQLPVVRCQNSTKLIGCLLSRQLVTARRHEFWFTFGPDPLRFSLDEFRDVTGLNCGAFDVQDSEASESVPPTMWNKLFDTAVGKLTVLSVLRMLGNEYLAVEKRLPLALIALVDGVLCPSNKDLKLTPRYVEMLSDVESFLAYPWGRESFLTTVPRSCLPLLLHQVRTHCKLCVIGYRKRQQFAMGFHLLCSCSYLMLCLCYWRKFPTQGTPPLSLIPPELALRRPLFSQSTK